MSIAEKIIRAKEDYDVVYEAAKKSMVDESKIIEKTVSGSVIAVDDVSEVPHEVGVQLSNSDENLFPYPYHSTTTITTNGITFTDNGDRSITISGIATADAYFYLSVIDFGNNNMWNESQSGNDYYVSGCKHFFYNGNNKIASIVIPNGTDYTTPITVNPSIKRVNEDFSGVTVEINEELYTPTPEGKVTIGSISPNMNFSVDTIGINITATYHKSWGMQTEYDRFWDTFQQNGTSTRYLYAFAYDHWTAETFKPKYDIRPTSAVGLFRNSKMGINLTQHLNNLGITLDLSQATDAGSYTFEACNFTELPELDFSKAGSLAYTFNECTALTAIAKLKVVTSQTFSGTFGNCIALKEIRFEGTIGKSLDLHWSTKLSPQSYDNIFSCLSTTATGVTLTVPTTAPDVYDALNGEGSWAMTLQMWCPSNWTVAYA